MFMPFKNRRFLLFFLGQAASSYGDNLFLIALMWFTISTTHSRVDVTLIVLAQMIPPIFGLFSGVLVDRWASKKRTMIITDIIRAALSAGLFMVALSSHHPMFAIVWLLVFCLALMGTFFGAAQNSMLGYIVAEESLEASAGLYQSGSTSTQLLGSLSGGALYNVLGAPFLFLGNALSYVISFCSLLFIKVTEPKGQDVEGSSLYAQWVEGLRFTLSNSYVVFIVVTALVANFTLAPLDMAMTVWIRTWTHHNNALSLSLVSMADLIGIIVGGLAVRALSTKFSPRGLLISGNLAVAFSIFLVGMVANLYWVMLWVCVDGIAVGFINASIVSELLKIIPEEMAGRVFGALGGLARIAAPVGALVFGAIVIYTRVPLALTAMAVPSLIVGLLLIFRTVARNVVGSLES